MPFPRLGQASIKRRLIGLLLGVSGMSMGFVLLFSIWQQLNTLQGDTSEKLQAIARAAGGASTAALVFQDGNAARDILADSLQAHPEVVAAAIYDPQGERFAEFGAAATLPGRFLASLEAPAGVRVFQPRAELVEVIHLDDEFPSTCSRMFQPSPIRPL